MSSRRCSTARKAGWRCWRTKTPRRVADEGYQQTENGYGVLDDGGYQVSVRTDMPGVTPRMWSWWFGWHGCDTRRYKLWHPRAHLSAAWKDGDEDDPAIHRPLVADQ